MRPATFVREHLHLRIERCLGMGTAGAAYLLNNGKVIKFTADHREKICVQTLILQQTENNQHLPLIYKQGEVNLKDLKRYTFYYIREALDDLIVKPEEQQFERIVGELEHLYPTLRFFDYLRPLNWGIRIGQPEIYVLRDLAAW